MAWAPQYVETDVALDYLNINDEDTVNPTLFDFVLDAVCRAVDIYSHRQFGSTDAPETRYYRPEWSDERGMWVVPCADFFGAPSAVAVDSGRDNTYATTVDPLTVIPLERNALSEGDVYTGLALPGVSLGGRPDEVRIVNTWGWPAVPKTVRTATLLQLNRIKTRQEAPFGVAGSPDNGSELRLLPKLDPDVAVMIKRFRRAALG